MDYSASRGLISGCIFNPKSCKLQRVPKHRSFSWRREEYNARKHSSLLLCSVCSFQACPSLFTRSPQSCLLHELGSRRLAWHQWDEKCFRTTVTFMTSCLHQLLYRSSYLHKPHYALTFALVISNLGLCSSNQWNQIHKCIFRSSDKMFSIVKWPSPMGSCIPGRNEAHGFNARVVSVS